MNAVLSFLGGIGEAITGALGFLLDLVLDFAYLVRLLGRVLAIIPRLFSWLPPELYALVIAALSVAVILKIIGR